MGCENREIVSKRIWDTYDKLLKDDRVKNALAFIEKNEGETIKNQIEICEIPAPSFFEQERGKFLKEKLIEIGFKDIITDSVDNIIATYKGEREDLKLYVGAHMDTVFERVNKIEVIKKGNQYYAPGIGDNSRGVAAIITVAKVMKLFDIKTVGDVVFCGTVCEEGHGGMRGCHTLFKEHNDIDGYIAVDGAGEVMIYKGLFCKHIKVAFNAVGGHSYRHFGIPSAIHTLGRAIAKVAEIRTPKDPKTTFNVGLISGGTAVSSIADYAEMEIDVRSEGKKELVKLENEIRESIIQAVSEEQERCGSDRISFKIEGDNELPGGRQPIDSDIVQTALGAFYSVGRVVDLFREAGATEANIPLSMEIPAIHMTAGGRAAGGHSLSECFDSTDSHFGPQAILLNILALAGLEGVTDPVLKSRRG